jgi:antagonist of KipI
MAFICVERPGLQTTVQDLGRWGFQAFGVSVSGAMDPFAHRLANALVGNARSAAGLEITLVGPSLLFEDERVVAVAGAEFDITMDRQPMPMNAPVVVQAGARVTFGRRRSGARAYLAVSGGIDTPPVFGSRSTHVPSRMGGFEGRLLASGDRIPIGPRSARPLAPRQRRPRASAAFVERPGRLRLISGRHLERFAPESLAELTGSRFVVAKDSDRMGYRLDGPALRPRGGADIISEATPIGLLQVPSSGQPILLMADRQTSGGYAQLGVVITADLGIAAQLAPGDAVSFGMCTQAEALAALIAEERGLLQLEDERS